MPFLTHASPFPSAPCCEGLSKLHDEGSTTQGRQDFCRCLKEASHSFGVDPKRAKELSPKCGVTTSVPIDLDLCNT
ncbi:hypothetical protein SLA2020_225350 [Shorea laevis]